MEFQVPKVLERKPIIAGYDLQTAIVIIIGALLFLFTVFSHFFIALAIPVLIVPFVHIQTKYPKEGEFMDLIKYNSGSKCIQANIKIELLMMQIKKENTTT